MRRRLLSLLLAFVMVLGMLPVSAFADTAPFTVTVGGAEITDITQSTLTWTSWEGVTSDVTCYTVTVPEGSEEATLTFAEEKQWTYYDSKGDYIGEGGTSWTPAKEHTVAIADSNSDDELDGISVQTPGAYDADYYIAFVYAASGGDSGEDTPSRPFTSIKIGGTEVAEENIIDKGTFYMGDYHVDEEGDLDAYDYVHEVPYFHVKVPCGTESVDVTYHGSYNILNDGAVPPKAHGYRTMIDGVDAVSSATVKGVYSMGEHTIHEDGTQTVNMPVADYVLKDGKGKAVTVEEEGGNFEAVCLFSFEYSGGEHNYQSGTCTVCGAADPNFSVTIPTGTNIQAITAVTEFAQGDEISFNMWDTDYGPFPSYIATVPAGTQTVTLTFVSGEYPAPYNDYYTGALTLSGGKVSLGVDENTGEPAYKGSGTSHAPTAVGDTHSIELNVADFLYLKDSYYVAYNSSNSPICLLTFDYPAGSHVHEYTKEVTKSATCYETGIETYTCSGCKDTTEGHSYTKEIPLVDHTYGQAEQTKAADCVNPGENTYTCSVCPEGTDGHTKTETVEALGHQYDDGTVTKEATCTEAGTLTKTCTREGCTEETSGHTKTETIKALGHNYQNGTCANNCGATCPLTDANGVFQLEDYEDLKWFANAVKEGQTTISAKLTANITVGEDWEGIGTSSKKFAGTFDGVNHTVTFNGTKGLFGYVKGTSASKKALIHNVITAGTVNGSAGIAGNAAYATVKNCINKAAVTSSLAAAGIVATADTYNCALTIENCGNEGKISAPQNAAGIVATTKSGAAISGCYNTGDISGSAVTTTGDGVGGIAGFAQSSSVSNCYNTGKISSSGNILCGGIVGNQYNGVTISNCYNAGECDYAITGRMYNKTAKVQNSYYLDTSSSYAGPEVYRGSTYNNAGYIGTIGEARSSAELGGTDIASKLGSAFQASCGGPVLSWQTAKPHTGLTESGEGICTTCKAGGTTNEYKAKYKVTKSTGGYEIDGTDTVAAESSYIFSVTINSGYEKTDAFKVYANGTALTEENGKYSVTPTGHFYITVTGVQEIPNAFGITLPKEGDGYRVVPCEGYTTTVTGGSDFKFKVNFINGFKAGDQFEVRVNNNSTITPVDEVYTISNITEPKTITVHDVEIIPCDPVTVKVDITKGEKNFYFVDATDTLMLGQEITVPYFELSDYGLERFYYNEYCYKDEDGNIRGIYVAGNRETAYGKVTTLHALIYMTDLFYLNRANDAGTGASYREDSEKFNKALTVMQTAGSSFTGLWGDGTNLNYHLNYVYPLAFEAQVNIGSTSDQQLLNNGDRITIHFITGAASGSAFGFFAANDENNTYDKNETIDYASVKQGETIKLTHYIADQGYNYTTAFKTGGSKELYWVKQGWQSANVEEPDKGDWNRDPQGDMTADAFKTDANGEITIDTTGWEVGTYYIAAQGGFTKGDGSAGADGFVSAGTEAGPAYFTLEVTEGEAEEIIYGDADGNGTVQAADALLIKQKVAEFDVTLNETAADVDGINGVQAADALLIEQRVAELIQSFPVEEVEE